MIPRHSHPVTTITASGLLPLFYVPEADLAWGLVEGLASAGIGAVEFLNRGVNARAVFAALVDRRQRLGLDVALGVGTVTDSIDARWYLERGADFIVSPGFEESVAELCSRADRPYVPGCLTPTEILRAESAGCELIKLFPAAAVGGPRYLRDVLGPRPSTAIVASGGISTDRSDIEAWFDAGAVAVGLGSSLVPSDRARLDVDEVAARARVVRSWIQARREA